MTTKAELVHQVVELLERANQILDEIGEALPDDEPKRWEPPAGPHFYGNAGVGSALGDVTNKKAVRRGFVSRTCEQVEAKDRATVARNILQTWVDEEGEAGDWMVKPVRPDCDGWYAVRLPAAYALPWDVLMSESTARRAADLLTRGVIKLEPNK